MEEIWKDVVGYEGLYQVSNLGRVKSLERFRKNNTGWYIHKERILIPRIDNGYFRLMLSKNNKREHKSIHILVSEMFLNHTTINGLVTDHIDGNKLNNNVNNLRIVTCQENVTTCFVKDKSLHNRIYSSSIKNILYRKDRCVWIVQIKINNKRKCLGSFKTENEALIFLNNYKNNIMI